MTVESNPPNTGMQGETCHHATGLTRPACPDCSGVGIQIIIFDLCSILSLNFILYKLHLN